MSTTYVAGRYLAKVLDHGFGKSESKGTPFFFCQIKVLARLDADGQQQPCPQYERSYRQYLANETGVNILRRDLRVLGVEVTDLRQLERGAPNAINLVGHQIEVVCELEPYDGKVVERWGIARTQKRIDLDAVLALQDQFGHLLRDGNTPAKPANAPTISNDKDPPS